VINILEFSIEWELDKMTDQTTKVNLIGMKSVFKVDYNPYDENKFGTIHDDNYKIIGTQMTFDDN
jgi:hypothetical protein